jgi:hypothetical protein
MGLAHASMLSLADLVNGEAAAVGRGERERSPGYSASHTVSS